jgi:death-on-curing protein
MIVISKEQILKMHDGLIAEFGGMRGIRNIHLLESAINNAFQTFEGNDLYPTIFDKAANLCFSLINNHAFIDGNKRIGVLVMLVFLELNGYKVNFSNKRLIDIGLKTASGELNQNMIKQWLIDNCE